MDLFIVTSVCAPCAMGLSYSPTRSVFSVPERKQQLLETILSIRKYSPHAYIVIAEASETDLGPDITAQSDYIQYQSNIPGVIEAVNSCSKAYGESTQIFTYLDSKHFKDHCRTFRTLAKISGRYVLTEQFDRHMDALDRIILMKKKDSPNEMITVYYRIPTACVDSYIVALKHISAIASVRLGCDSIEKCLFESFAVNYDDRLEVPSLGVAGRVSVCGSYVCI